MAPYLKGSLTMTVKHHTNAFYSILVSTALTLLSAFCLALEAPQLAYAEGPCSRLLQTEADPQIQGLSRTLAMSDLLLSPLGQSIWRQRWFQKEIQSAIASSIELKDSFRDGVNHITEVHFSQHGQLVENFILDIARSDKETRQALLAIQRNIYLCLLKLSLYRSAPIK